LFFFGNGNIIVSKAKIQRVNSMTIRSRQLSISGNKYVSCFVTALSLRQSTQNRSDLSFIFTRTILKAYGEAAGFTIPWGDHFVNFVIDPVQVSKRMMPKSLLNRSVFVSIFSVVHQIRPSNIVFSDRDDTSVTKQQIFYPLSLFIRHVFG